MTGLDGRRRTRLAARADQGIGADVIALLARPKLGLPRDVLYDPKRLAGDVAIELTLGFPLINALAVADIDIKAEAAVSGMSLRTRSARST
jgi:hypothetical protein